MALASGTHLGSYEIVSTLGSGGMGEVYRARDRRLGRDVAVKVLRRELAADPERVRRFEREARSASALNHPNIVHVYDVGEHASIPYIAMEYVEGRTLHEVLGETRLPTERSLRIATQIADGLAKAHAGGVIHRDLKPQNLMITADGFVKILDFGLAKLMPQGFQADSNLTTMEAGRTAPGVLLGTAGFMSPEQAKGEPADFRSDQFSFGVVLYEMATGMRPFERPTVVEALAAIIKEPPRPPCHLNPELPEDFGAIIQRCLEKAPEARFETTRELAVALRSAAERLSRESSESGVILHRGPPQRARGHTVGREEGLAVLREGLLSVARGRGELLCVTGEAGIGKTTLVETFLEVLASRPQTIPVGRGRCSERLAGAEAYLPVLEALEDLVRPERPGTAARLLEAEGPTWYRQVMRVAAGETSSSDASSLELLKRELIAFLQKMSAVEPIVLFFDDLHWADVSTVDLLSYLGGHFDSLRALIIATYRPEELRLSRHPFQEVKLELQSRGLCKELSLPFLSPTHISSYLELEFPAHLFPADFRDVIHAKTEGSPLFMVDLLRYLRDRGVIAREADSWLLVGTVPEIQRDMPESIGGMIQRKLDRLGETERRLMLAASIQGHEFHSVILSDVLRMDPVDVEEGLQALERVHALIEPVDEETFPDRTFTLRCRFVHGLYQNALYDSMTPTRRASLSSQVARALESHCGERESEFALHLAFLFEAGREPAPATRYYRLAAENAARVFAYHETINLSGRGLELLAALPESRERGEEELGLQIALGGALLALTSGGRFSPIQGQGTPRIEEVYGRARELCRQLGEARQLFQVLGGVFAFSFVRQSFLETRELAAELLHVANEANDAESLLQARYGMGATLLHLGEFAAARQEFDEVLRLYQPDSFRSRPRVYGHDTGVAGLCRTALTLWFLGYPEQARSRCSEGRALAEEQSHLLSRIYASTLAAILHQLRREPEELLEAAGTGASLATEHGFEFWAAFDTVLRGWVLSQRGDEEKGIAEIRRGLGDCEATGTWLFRTYFLGLLAEAYGKAHRPAEGLEALDQGLDLVQTRDERFYEAELHRLKGELLADAEEVSADAETSFGKAIDVARRQQARSLELRSMTSLARLWQRHGRGEAARERLSEIYRWFDEGWDTPDLTSAKGLLASLDR